jgi:hypothetical protein
LLLSVQAGFHFAASIQLAMSSIIIKSGALSNIIRMLVVDKVFDFLAVFLFVFAFILIVNFSFNIEKSIASIATSFSPMTLGITSANFRVSLKNLHTDLLNVFILIVLILVVLLVVFLLLAIIIILVIVVILKSPARRCHPINILGVAVVGASLLQGFIVIAIISFGVLATPVLWFSCRACIMFAQLIIR